jgi:hypothetical protein
MAGGQRIWSRWDAACGGSGGRLQRLWLPKLLGTLAALCAGLGVLGRPKRRCVFLKSLAQIWPNPLGFWLQNPLAQAHF